MLTLEDVVDYLSKDFEEGTVLYLEANGSSIIQNDITKTELMTFEDLEELDKFFRQL